MARREFVSRISVRPPWGNFLVAVIVSCALLVSCGKEEAKPKVRPPAQVSVITIGPRDTPVTIEFIGQTQSSHQVEIRARVNGFLDKRLYTEGGPVKAGQVMFQMDPKPFQAQLDAVQGSLAQQQARLKTAQANLARVQPLVAQNALSQKDLDDAIGQEQTAAAAVESAKAEVEQAKINLGYTTINTPVSGLSSYARVQEGAYVNLQNSLLTYVARIDPIWVNFSLSENDLLKYKEQARRGLLRMPRDNAFVVEVVLADGSLFPEKGRITFADAEYNAQTGTFLIRASVDNPGQTIRPNQYVRARLKGALRPQAILVPQRTVQQGAKGHFIWVVNKESKAEYRPVTVGDWLGNDLFISEGLRAGDQVIVDGAFTLRPGEPVAAKPAAARPVSAVAVKATPPGIAKGKP